MTWEPIDPVWGKSYAQGYIGFVLADHKLVGGSIAYFTRWNRSRIAVSHAFIVTSRYRCVEALITGGVQHSNIEKYFQPGKAVCFKQPVTWTPKLGSRLAERALEYIGAGYDHWLNIVEALANSMLLHPFDVRDKWCYAAASRKRFRCSGLAAQVMQDEIDLVHCHYTGTTSRTSGEARDNKTALLQTPQQLFEDEYVFEPWKYKNKV